MSGQDPVTPVGIPRLAEAVVRRFAPEDCRDDLAGDLAELFQVQVRRRGALRARWWYWWQALSCAIRFSMARLGGDGGRPHRGGAVGLGGVRGRERAGSGMSWLDWKLGARMLLKYPGLSALGGLSLAAAIAIGAVGFEVSQELLNPRLPFADAHRMVRLEVWDTEAAAAEPRTVYEFNVWREGLNSVTGLAAFRRGDRNVLTAEGRFEPFPLAEVTASMFDLTGVPPFLGRPLRAEDEGTAATPVVVLSHDFWQRHFLGDAAILGRVITVGRTQRTVVGVMPPGYGFPWNEDLWVPLATAEAAAPRTGPPVQVMGRLAEGVDWAGAEAELKAVSTRIAADHPGTHARLEARPRPYVGRAPGDPIRPENLVLHLVVLLVLGAVSANVATLIFARTAMREPEIIVRHALGASRSRVVGQIVVETLVLALAAAAVGLAIAQAVIRYAGARTNLGMDQGFPFWVDLSLEPATIAYALLLAVVAAVLTGVLPALKATGPSVQRGLQGLTTAGSGMRFGGVWSVIIGTQIAVTLITLPMAVGIASEAVRDTGVRADFPAERYLTFRLSMDAESAPGELAALPDEERAERRVAAWQELERRLREEPGVTDVAFADRLPGTSVGLTRVEVQRGAGEPELFRGNFDGYINVAEVGPGFLPAFDVEVVSGRGLSAGDERAAERPVLVNEAFQRNLGGNPVGVRIRSAPPRDAVPGPWQEIVGVIADLGVEPTDRGEADLLLRPVSVADLATALVAVRTMGAPDGLTPRVAELARQVDPSLRVYDVVPFQELVRRRELPMLIGTFVFAVIVLVALTFSAAGLYALMAVAVTRRTREIGVRMALGADTRGVLRAIFGRAARQLGGGILAGNALILFIVWRTGASLSPVLFLFLGGASLVMALVGTLACLAPARRALRVQPTEALRQG